MEDDEPRFSLLRDALAVVIVAIACPLAVYGGAAAGCIGQGGFEADCAIDNGVWIAPLMLLVAGFVAGLVTRGWTGLFLVLVGTALGMASILVLSFAVGRPVPVDPVSAIIATVWFMAPIAIGYAGGRIVWRVLDRRAAPPA